MDNASIWFIGNIDAAQDTELRALIDDLRSQNYHVEMRVTWESGQARHFCQEALDAGADAVFGCGGDGTLHELLGPLLAANRDANKKSGPKSTNQSSEIAPMMGGLPYGTGNDFLTSLGLTNAFQPADVATWLTETPRQIDVGRLNDTYFLNMATVGMGAEITADTPRGFKNVAGKLAYFAKALPAALDIQSTHATIRGDFEWEGDLAFLFIGNSIQAGGGWRICPAASIVDGLLDVVIVPNMPLNEMVRTRQALLDASRPGDFGDLIYRQVEHLEVSFDDPLPINLDGEPCPAENLEIQVYPKAISFLVPTIEKT